MIIRYVPRYSNKNTVVPVTEALSVIFCQKYKQIPRIPL